MAAMNAIELTSIKEEKDCELHPILRNSIGLVEPATKRGRFFKSKEAAASIMFMFPIAVVVALSLSLFLLSTQQQKKDTVHLEPSHNHSSTVIASSGQEQNSISYGSPFVILTEGGCSGTTAVGKYTRRIVDCHGIDRTKDVHFEFLNAKEYNSKSQHYKNPYFQDIVHERNITLVPGFDEQYWNLVQESVQRAQILAIETSTLLFFKANVQQYLILRPLFDALGNVTYAGYYRENVLDRCVCMVRDCFQEAESFGTAVFGHNGTETDLCFHRREHPEWNVQAKFTNVENCLKEDQNRVDVIRGQDFDSFTDKELFRFEQSTSNDDFQLSVEAWMEFLQPLLPGALDREIVASVLEEGRGTRETSSQESKVYNYVELKEELIRSPKWEGFLHN